MDKPKLIILESPDGLGKTTQAKLLAEKLNARLISQPSSDNCVGFIRAEAKKNPHYTPLERQLLVAVSHTVDAFTKFKDNENVVMDRSYLSGLVYGKLTGLDQFDVDLLATMLKSVYEAQLHKYDTKIVFLDRDSRLDEEDDDVFERTIKWKDLKNEYLSIFNKNFGNFYFTNGEKKHLVCVDGSIDETFNKICKAIGLDNEEKT